jgi:asparagine synthase (glutamine-hydrolysing)
VCGIAGQLRLDAGSPPLDGDELARVSAALAGRGPDGEGEWRSPCGRLALAHRRLAVLDLSPASAQPMRSADGRFALVFNGEIYDFRAAARELAATGVALRTSGDAELLLELLARQGPAVLSRLRGMYAFALWDGERGELLLARDPYGIKPLYYALDGGLLRFASQVRALEAGGGLPSDLEPAGVAGFLAWGAVPEPWTLRRAIRALPAGHLLRASPADGVRLEPAPFVPPPGLQHDPGLALTESVADHLVSDVPVAVFLSAGLDSALVAALARRAALAAAAAPPLALTLTWAEARGTERDEEPLARATARALGLEHVVREVSADEVRAAWPTLLAAMDQPSIDGVNTWLVARLAREQGFKVALSGLGGDELLGGYPSFAQVPRWQRWARRLGRVPGLAGDWPLLARHLPARLPAPRRRKLARLLELGRSLAGAYVLRRALFLPGELELLDAGDGAGARPLERFYDPVLDAWERLGEGLLGAADGLLADPWRAVHRLESTLYLRNQLLRDADWAGMAHGVEIRVPLVDARLRAALEAVGFEPARSQGKAALVRQLAPELPAELFARPKSGFQLPIADWLDESPPPAAPRPVGEQSRRLALRVLAEFGIEVEEPRREGAADGR